ncbi:MAG: hypothetical protein B7Y95_19060 [Rhizobiales bacterium 32-66-11]|nr:MAG: hypothetical protein B7Y95_19060 [Rhizobiales bacterium 32-66-11]
MNHDRYDDAYIRDILSRCRTIAVVGASPNPARPSFFVTKYLSERGFEVYPINPGQVGKEIAGRAFYGRLADVPVPIDMVDVFRAPAFVPSVSGEIGWTGVNSRTISSKRPQRLGSGVQRLSLSRTPKPPADVQ